MAIISFLDYAKAQAPTKGWTVNQTELMGAIGRRPNEIHRSACLENI